MKKSSKWNWYGVKIIKQLIVTGEPDMKLIDESYIDDGKQDFEESLMLVKAQSFDHAYRIAEKKTLSDAHKYLNIYGQQVEWKFIEAVDCFEIMDELKSGAEVYSCFHSTDNNKSALEFLDEWFNDTENGCRRARHL